MEIVCAFGPLLRKYRQGQGLSLWSFSVAVPYRQANIQRIERGVSEPRVGLAMRLLVALQVDPGEFMQTLALTVGLRQAPGETLSKSSDIDKLRLTAAMIENAVHPFGKLLRETRVAYGKSQKAVAEEASYTVRNLISVEAGRQEPQVMTALKLVCATGCDINCFFSEFALLYRQDEPH